MRALGGALQTRLGDVQRKSSRGSKEVGESRKTKLRKVFVFARVVLNRKGILLGCDR